MIVNSQELVMKRRNFLQGVAGGAGLFVAGPGTAIAAGTGLTTPNYYLLRHYEIIPGAEVDPLDAYFEQALLPAANRLGITPVGVFSGWFGPTTAMGKYVLLPSPSLDLLVNLDDALMRDAEYARRAESFLAHDPDSPPFYRMESMLLGALPKFPGIDVPEDMRGNKKRIFELRTYEQPTDRNHRIKLEMFQNGEHEILEGLGLRSIFYGRNLIGPRLPALTYMWIYDSLELRQRAEEAWAKSPDRAKLFATPRYNGVGSLFGNVLMRPTAYSQI